MNPNGPYHNDQHLDNYKKNVEAIYINGLVEVHKQEQVELQKLDAVQKQVHLEQEKVAVAQIKEKQAAERKRLLELRQWKRGL